MANLNKFEKENESAIYQSFFVNMVQEKICEIMEKKNISKTKLAKKLNVGKSEVSRLLSDDRNLRVKSVAKIFHAIEERLEIITSTELQNKYNVQEEPFANFTMIEDEHFDIQKASLPRQSVYSQNITVIPRRLLSDFKGQYI